MSTNGPRNKWEQDSKRTSLTTWWLISFSAEDSIWRNLFLILRKYMKWCALLSQEREQETRYLLLLFHHSHLNRNGPRSFSSWEKTLNCCSMGFLIAIQWSMECLCTKKKKVLTLHTLFIYWNLTRSHQKRPDNNNRKVKIEENTFERILMAFYNQYQ